MKIDGSILGCSVILLSIPVFFSWLTLIFTIKKHRHSYQHPPFSVNIFLGEKSILLFEGVVFYLCVLLNMLVTVMLFWWVPLSGHLWGERLAKSL